MIYHCCNEHRKSLVLSNPALNGIDYLEVLDSDETKLSLGGPPQLTLLIHCLNPLTQSSWSVSNIVISGGESIKQIGIDWVVPANGPFPTGLSNSPTPLEIGYFTTLPDHPNIIVVRTHVAGDFSTYRLRLVNDATQSALDPFQVTEVLTGFDSQLAEVDFSFKVECPPDFDCAPQTPNCPPDLPAPPPINYLAKDYGGFRSIILDRLSQLLPAWGGTSEADLGVTLAELVAYVGDHLSYEQDAVATEAYIETARRRVSLRRHALLVDYHVHDGCNARAWIQLQVGAAGAPGTPVFLDRSKTRFYTTVPGMTLSLAVGSGNEETALLGGVQAFEPMQDANLYHEHNQLFFYTWGDTGCCLPIGATEATLAGSFPNLQPGDVLIFEEVIGPQTGDPADADLRHRCAVRLTQITTEDGLGNPLQDALLDPSNPVLVTEIQWAKDDALQFPLCISSSYLDSDGTEIFLPNVSVAYGNVVLADHGLSISGKKLRAVPQPRLFWPADPAADRCKPKPRTSLPVRYRPVLPDSPVTQAVPLPVAGVPVTPGVIALAGLGYSNLTDSNGLVSLLIQPNDPLSWPPSFGVMVNANASIPSNIDLYVVYAPASGSPAPVVLEAFTNLSLTKSASNYAGTQINSFSQLIQVPTSFVPPTTTPAGFPATPTHLLSGSVDLKDLATTTFLKIQATNPMGWAPLFGVVTQVLPQVVSVPAVPPEFNLLVVYDPPLGGVGVNLPVTVEQFKNLSVATATGPKGLVKLMSFEKAPNPNLSATDLMNFNPDEAVPAIALQGPGAVEGLLATWMPLHDLLESSPTDTVFVVEVESDGTATLRFGDDTHGYRPEPGSDFSADYRIGNGTAGNVGPGSLVNLECPEHLVQKCRNPLPAVGGTDPETSDQIRRRAPQAFLTQERAVTMADYAAMTELSSQVDRAEASLRWTGSWYTVFVAVEPVGGGLLSRSLSRTLKKNLERYRLAGRDLELDSPQYVSLELELQVCVDPDYFESDVEQALLEILSNRILPNGQKGVFYPDNFTFGQTVYLSPVYAAARSVSGVTTVVATVFQPQGIATNQYLTAGEMKLGPRQVARLENDRSYPNHGQLTLMLEGGKK